MIVSTKAIVLGSIKYGDTNLIVKCFTETEGCKSYLLRGVLSSKKGKVRASYFQPLTQLKIVANHNKKGNLNSIKEVELLHPYNTIYTNIFKQSIVLFLSEVLSNAIQEEEENLNLYTFLETSMLWLDTHDKSTNFHLLFLLNLSKFLGFYPDINNATFDYFDLENGCFSNQSVIAKNSITGDELIEFKKLLGINIDDLDKVKYNAQNRHLVLKVLIRYFELHLNGFKNPKSLEVLKAVFS